MNSTTPDVLNNSSQTKRPASAVMFCRIFQDDLDCAAVCATTYLLSKIDKLLNTQLHDIFSIILLIENKCVCLIYLVTSYS